MPNYSVGKNRTELTEWLLQNWLKDGPPVCFIEGFSGVGKTSLARDVIKNSSIKPVMIEMPDFGLDQTDNLFLNLATELSEKGINDLADAVTEGKSINQAVGTLLNKPLLVIVDEFQKAISDETGRPTETVMSFLGRLANRPNIPGRILLLTNQLIERSKWSEAYEIKTLSGLASIEAEDLLGKLLNDTGRNNEISQERRPDIVNLLGRNPRAIHVLVSSLERSSLDDLIGKNPEIWEALDREVSAELLYSLERELLKETLELLKPETATLLRRLSVHRKSIKREAIEILLPEEAKFATVRDDLINRFLMEQHSGLYSLNPVVREISLQRLKEKPNEFKLAHARAADHYMRHFKSKEIVDSGKLGGYFVEARYHLVQAQRDNELEQIAGRFENHLKAQFTSADPIPRQLDELNERIATLTALLETPGAKGLEYYLARLYEARSAPGDIQKALVYSERSTGKQAPVQSWVLRLRLEARINGPAQIGLIAREGITSVSAGKGAEQIYTVSAELLTKAGRDREAITLLNDGIVKIPVTQNVFSLYQSAGELLAQAGRIDEAITLLKDGIVKIPVTQNVVSLYQSAGELLAQAGRIDEAITLLNDGIVKIPVTQNVVSLYQSAGELLAQAGRIDEATTLLKDGIANVPVSSNVFLLYTYCSYQLARHGKFDEAVDLLKDGIAKIPIKYSVIALYMTIANLLCMTGKYDEEIIVLRDGIDRFPFGAPQRYKLFEPILNIFWAQQNFQAIEDYLIQAKMLHMEKPQIAYCKALKLIIMRQWESAAKWIQEEIVKFLFYRPLIELGIFCWLCVGNLNAAEVLLQKTQPQKEPYDSLNWLKAWINLKSGDIASAKESLSLFLNSSINDHEVSEHFLIKLWDSPPKDLNLKVKDIAYKFPILPSLLTGLDKDILRLPYGPSVLSSASIHQNQSAIPHAIVDLLSDQNLNKLPNWPTWMDDLLNPTQANPQVDVGIVIALEEEFRELAPQINTKPYYNPEIKQYYYLFERSSIDQKRMPYRCVVTFMGTMGPTDAGIVGDRLIAQFNPKTIVSIGIAGSMDKDVLVGNVVVADQTDEYLASSKAVETSDKQDWDFQFSGNPYKSDPGYVAHAMNLKYAYMGATQNWERNNKQKLLEWIGSVAIEKLIQELLIGDFPGIQTGHIASGPTVGAAKQFVQWLKDKHDRKLLALEMESAGVLNAAHKRAVSSLIIRGISDYSDERKNRLDEIGKGVLRRYAMNNALSLLWLLMDLQLI